MLSQSKESIDIVTAVITLATWLRYRAARKTERADRSVTSNILNVENPNIYLKEKAREQRIRDDMRKRFGKEPDVEDVEFRVLNDQVVESEFAGNWGFARKFRLDMAMNLEKRKRHGQN